MLWCSRHVARPHHQANPSSSLVRFVASLVRLLSVVHSAAERKWSTQQFTGTLYRCFGAAGMSLGDAIKQIQVAHLSHLQRHLCCSCLSARSKRSQSAGSTVHWYFALVLWCSRDVARRHHQADPSSSLVRFAASWCGSFQLYTVQPSASGRVTVHW